MSHQFEVRSENISDCRFQIVDFCDRDNQFRGAEGSDKALRPARNSPVPKLTAYPGRYGNHSAAAAFIDFCRCELSCRLPCPIYRIVSKLGIVLEETDETLFWLELLVDSGVAQSDKTIPLVKEANELASIFVASLRTAKGVKSAI